MALASTTQQKYPSCLPVEVLDEIGNNIQKVRDLKAFATMSSSIYNKIGYSVIRRDPIKALIHYAAVNNTKGIGEALSAGADINAIYKLQGDERKKLLRVDKFICAEEFMPLHIAVIMGSVDATAYLLEQGASLNATAGYRKTTAFWLATDLGSVATMRLLHSRGSDINRGDSYGTTPLHLSSRKGNKEIVEWLLDLGANKDAKEVGWEGDTALGIAAGAGKLDICHLLLERGCDIDMGDRTPLHIAAARGNQMLAEYLLKRGSKVDLIDSSCSHTALLIAAHRGDIAMVYLLQTNGGDINHADQGGSTALHHAALFTDLELTQHLLKHNADVHKQDYNGNIALGLAAQELAAAPFRYGYFSQGALIYDPQEKTYRSREIYKLLLKSNSNRFHRNNEGDAPIEIYQRRRQRWMRYIRDGGSW